MSCVGMIILSSLWDDPAPFVAAEQEPWQKVVGLGPLKTRASVLWFDI